MYIYIYESIYTYINISMYTWLAVAFASLSLLLAFCAAKVLSGGGGAMPLSRRSICSSIPSSSSP